MQPVITKLHVDKTKPTQRFSRDVRKFEEANNVSRIFLLIGYPTFGLIFGDRIRCDPKYFKAS